MKFNRVKQLLIVGCGLQDFQVLGIGLRCRFTGFMGVGEGEGVGD